MAAARLLAGLWVLGGWACLASIPAAAGMVDADRPASAPRMQPAIQRAQVNWDDVLWNTIKDGTDPALFNHYLKRFPRGAHADEARRRVDALKKAAPGPAKAAPAAIAAPKPLPAPSAASKPPAPPPVAASSSRPAGGKFVEPRIGRVRLDGCLTWARDCGRPAADEFCLRQGYAGALEFAPQPNVTPTRLISDGQLCDGRYCGSFASITCTGTGSKAPAQQAAAQPPGLFRAPFVNQALVDHCLHWARDCGKPAADAFCRLAGFSEADSFERTQPGQRSFVLGDQRVCSAATCIGFSRIYCRTTN